MLQFRVNEFGDRLVLPATIEDDSTFDDLMAAGRYRYPDPDITASTFFPPRAHHTSSTNDTTDNRRRLAFFWILEVAPGVKMNSDEVIAYIRAYGVLATTFLEQLTVCAVHPHSPANGRLAAYATARKIGRTEPNWYVPVVYRYNGRSYIEPHRIDFGFRPGDGFLVRPSIDRAVCLW